jgi:hypothetical protein
MSRVTSLARLLFYLFGVVMQQTAKCIESGAELPAFVKNVTVSTGVRVTFRINFVRQCECGNYQELVKSNNSTFTTQKQCLSALYTKALQHVGAGHFTDDGALLIAARDALGDHVAPTIAPAAAEGGDGGGGAAVQKRLRTDDDAELRAELASACAQVAALETDLAALIRSVAASEGHKAS